MHVSSNRILFQLINRFVILIMSPDKSEKERETTQKTPYSTSFGARLIQCRAKYFISSGRSEFPRPGQLALVLARPDDVCCEGTGASAWDFFSPFIFILILLHKPDLTQRVYGKFSSVRHVIANSQFSSPRGLRFS